MYPLSADQLEAADTLVVALRAMGILLAPRDYQDDNDAYDLAHALVRQVRVRERERERGVRAL